MRIGNRVRIGLRFFGVLGGAAAKSSASDQPPFARNPFLQAMTRRSGPAQLGSLPAFSKWSPRGARPGDECRVGEMMAEQKAAGGMFKGAATKKSAKKQRGSDCDPRSAPQLSLNESFVPPADAPTITLADAGIDKHQADRARKLAAVPKAEFEQIMARHRAAQEVVETVTR